MLELLLCSLLTIFPDYLYRRYAQGKRLGKEITLYSVWFELRWGHHRLPDADRRADHGGVLQPPLHHQRHPVLQDRADRFRDQRTRRRGQCGLQRRGQTGRADLPARQFDPGGGRGGRAPQDRRDRGQHGGRRGPMWRRPRARSRRPGAPISRPSTNWRPSRSSTGATPRIVAARDIERLQNHRRGAPGDQLPPRPPPRIPPRRRSRRSCRPRRPAPRPPWPRPRWISRRPSSAPASSGRVEQFTLRVGDIVNPFMRPAGILIPEGAGRSTIQAGFGQIEAQVMKVGMVAEVTCVSKPWTVIPMVVTGVQDFIAAGQFRGGEQLIDPQQVLRPGTILVYARAALRGRPRRRDARQFLHRQRLYEQSRSDRLRQRQHHQGVWFFTRWMPSGSCMP